MTIKNAAGTAVTKTTMKSAMTTVTQKAIYTPDQDYFEYYVLEGTTGETGKKLVAKQGVTITEDEVDRLFPTAVFTAMTPTTGPAAGGTVVTITGTNLLGVSNVTFGGTNGTSLTIITSSKIQVTTPAKAAGAHAVVIVDDAGNVAAGNFTYA